MIVVTPVGTFKEYRPSMSVTVPTDVPLACIITLLKVLDYSEQYRI